MPANIAHILLANKAYDNLKKDTAFDEITQLINYRIPLFYVGSIGPDLPSYKTSALAEAVLNQMLVRPFVNEINPQEEDASFFLHSTRPNLFPYYLMETNFAYAEIKNNKLEPLQFNKDVLVFTLGYVTHIAADQIIHKLVREIVGPYYRSLRTSQMHAECEVHQDIFLFYEKYPTRTFSSQVMKGLININRFGFEYDQFCNLLSLAISKAGYKRIKKDDIEGWFNGINTTFDMMEKIGPYTSAIKNYKDQKDNLKEFPLYKKYFRDELKQFDYMMFYDDAVTLALKYMKVIIDLWNKPDFTYDNFVKYQKNIDSKDLTSPF